MTWTNVPTAKSVNQKKRKKKRRVKRNRRKETKESSTLPSNPDMNFTTSKTSGLLNTGNGKSITEIKKDALLVVDVKDNPFNKIPQDICLLSEVLRRDDNFSINIIKSVVRDISANVVHVFLPVHMQNKCHWGIAIFSVRGCKVFFDNGYHYPIPEKLKRNATDIIKIIYQTMSNDNFHPSKSDRKVLCSHARPAE
ncbi:hypothetical protein ACROYT_G014185 [Oculina patagonica]